jgi:hypothetical protein
MPKVKTLSNAPISSAANMITNIHVHEAHKWRLLLGFSQRTSRTARAQLTFYLFIIIMPVAGQAECNQRRAHVCVICKVQTLGWNVEAIKLKARAIKWS